jgi:hypothetical protein
MRFIFGILVCLLAPEALAQNCVTTGSIASCDNGLSGIESGGITFWSDSTSTWSGNMTFLIMTDAASLDQETPTRIRRLSKGALLSDSRR